MGEGEGAKDVSDQIENEDQLLGAKQKDAPEEDQVGLPQPYIPSCIPKAINNILARMIRARQNYPRCSFPWGKPQSCF